MDSVDRAVLNVIQTGFPVASRPYAVIGEKTGLTEEEAFSRIQNLKKGGIIRRIGASYDSRGLHFSSTLCSAKVPPEKIEAVVKAINKYHEVTHNYERNHAYNIWFTLIAESKERIQQILDEICGETGISVIRNMPAIKKFKIKVDFKFKDAGSNGNNAEEDE
ncbi:MAG: Lrp/AsnC family transcriptional regulator [Nitrospinae bacterium]|nr:Lrp/AsnC family transcriptional regulator [Nitrospinota bacterium]